MSVLREVTFTDSHWQLHWTLSSSCSSSCVGTLALELKLKRTSALHPSRFVKLLISEETPTFLLSVLSSACKINDTGCGCNPWKVHTRTCYLSVGYGRGA